MTQLEWSANQARMIAAEVRRHRQIRGMSAQTLADRTAELGHPITRNVIASLESGRRDVVTTADLLTLARALKVPPAALLFPVGRQDAVEVLPGMMTTPWAALQWFAGADELPDGGRAWNPEDPGTAPFFLYDHLAELDLDRAFLIRDLAKLRRETGKIADLPPEVDRHELIDAHRQALEGLERSIRRVEKVRQDMVERLRRLELTPPAEDLGGAKVLREAFEREVGSDT